MVSRAGAGRQRGIGRLCRARRWRRRCVRRRFGRHIHRTHRAPHAAFWRDAGRGGVRVAWRPGCRARSTRRPVGARAARLCHARPAGRAGRAPRAVVHHAARLHRAHGGPLAPVHLPHRRRAGTARHADRAGAAALHRIGLQPASRQQRQGRRHVAVHARHGARLPADAKHAARRPAQRARLDPRCARLSAEALRHVWRLAPGAGGLQLGPGQRQARHRAQPGRGPAHRLQRHQHAGRNAQLRAQAAGGEEHHRQPAAHGRRAAADRKPPVFRHRRHHAGHRR